MAEIKFSPEAINDLQQTKEYIIEELCNEQAAVNMVSKITKRIRMLADFPESGSPLPFSPFGWHPQPISLPVYHGIPMI